MPTLFFMLFVTGISWWSSQPAQAAGFALLQQGTAAMGQGNAFVADASDPSAIFYNPAGLTQLHRTEVYSATIFNYPDREFDGADGGFSQTHHRLYRGGSLFLAGPVTSRVALGLGLFSPFGLGTQWPDNWAGRYLTTSSNLRTYNVNPVVAVKPWDKFSVAAGVNVMWSAVRLQRKIPLIIRNPGPGPALIQLSDGEIDLGGEGHGLGFNVGLLYEPVSGIKLGAAYRSEIKVTHRGSLTTRLPLGLPLVPDNSGDADITFPPSLTFGINYARLKPWAFEFDVTWTGWSSFKELKVNVERPVLSNGVPTMTLVQPRRWRDAWAFRFGANYALTENVKLRAGYIYDLTPVPDSTFDPQIPDSNRHVFTVGQDLKYKRLTLGIAYNLVLSEERNKTSINLINGQPLVPPPFQALGSYRSYNHSLGLSASFWF